MKIIGIFFFLLLLIFSTECRKLVKHEPLNIVVNNSCDSVRFAVIGDYGDSGINEANVAELVKSLDPDFIITTGDNNYPDGKEKTIQENIGQYYCSYIYNFDASEDQKCEGKAFDTKINRFFPSLGNHDYANLNGSTPYLNYFTLPGNESYYEFIWGPIHFYALDSNQDIEEQQLWFEDKLSNSKQNFNIVFFHHSPYSSGLHGDKEDMQWDFDSVDLVLTGHDHIYERIEKKTKHLPIYVITGLGGRYKRLCNENPLDTNIFDSFCYDEKYGTMFIEANSDLMKIMFISTDDEMIDYFEINK